MDLQKIKFVNIFRKIPDGPKKGEFEVAEIPITQPQKIRAYIDMGDLQPYNAAVNDHGWRLDPAITAQIRDTLENPMRLEQIAKETGKPLDMVNAFHVLMYEIARNRQLAAKASKNSLDKTAALSEYEQAVAAARAGEQTPEPGTGTTYTPKGK